MKNLYAAVAVASLAVAACAAIGLDRSAEAFGLYNLNSISVQGTALTSVQPDLLIVTLGVETRNDTAIEALWSNSILMNSTVTAILATGVTEDEISTSQFNIRPVYGDYIEETNERPLIGYDVANALSIKTTNLEIAPDIIDAAVAAGTNRVNSVHFTLSPELESEIRESLIADAVLNAKAKAETALAPLDYEITGVRSIMLSEYGIPYYEFSGMESVRAQSMPRTQFFTSDQEISTNVDVTFTISKKL